MKPKAFIISLKRAKDRREHAIAQAEKAGLDFEVIEAVDARAFRDDKGILDREALNRVQPHTNQHWGAEFKISEICIYRSHLNAMQRMLNLGLEWCLILEDDFALKEAPYSLLDVCAELEEHKSLWHHCLLHHDLLWFNSAYRMRGVFAGSKTLNIVRETGLVGVAYAVTAPFAKFVVDNMDLMDSPADHMICRLSRDESFTFIQSSFAVCGSAGFDSTQE